MIQITCYQTCKIDSKDWNTLFDELPHLAKNTTKNFQWLGEGFYFWPDNDRFAKWWGEERLQVPYCITSYAIRIEYDMIFDMVGNVSHILYFFETLLVSYQKLYDRARRHAMTKLPVPTVATVIDHMRRFFKQDLFNFNAMKVIDSWIDTTFCLDFTPNAKDHEQLPGLGRIQMCVFTDAEDCIHEKTPYFPQEYCDVIAQAA